MGRQPPEALGPDRRYQPNTAPSRSSPHLGQRRRAAVSGPRRARPPSSTRGLPQQTLSNKAPSARSLASAVCDVRNDAHRKGSIDGQYFLGIDADLALASDDRPIDLVVVLPCLDLGDVRHLVRLVLDGQVLRPTDDRSGRHLWVNSDRNAKPPIQGEGVVI